MPFTDQRVHLTWEYIQAASLFDDVTDGNVKSRQSIWIEQNLNFYRIINLNFIKQSYTKENKF